MCAVAPSCTMGCAIPSSGGGWDVEGSKSNAGRARENWSRRHVSMCHASRRGEGKDSHGADITLGDLR